MPTYLSKFCCIFVALSLLMMPPSLSVAARRAYPGQIIEQIDFRDVSVGDALKILADQSNLNIIASREAAEIRVTMFLRRVTAMEVIEAISKTYNLWYQVDGNANIVRIYTVKEYRLEEVEFKREETEIFTMKNAKNALDLAETIQNLFSERVLLSYGRNQNELIKDLSQRFARFDMIDGRTSLGQGGGSGGGGGGRYWC
jgi:general secretion pathway protein D